MKVVILGAGHVAAHLTRALLESAISVSQIYNRTLSHAEEIAKQYNLAYTDKISQIHKADLYIIATTGDAIEETSYHIPFDDVLVVHTAGSLGMDILRGGYRKGVVYPMQSFATTRALRYEEVPFMVETEHEEDYIALEKLLKKISFKVYKTTLESRSRMQLAKVMACDMVNYMYSYAEKLAAEAGVPYESLLPVIEETAKRAGEQLPSESLKDAVFLNNDEGMLERHYKLLKQDDIMLHIYELMSKEFVKRFKNEFDA